MYLEDKDVIERARMEWPILARIPRRDEKNVIVISRSVHDLSRAELIGWSQHPGMVALIGALFNNNLMCIVTLDKNVSWDWCFVGVDFTIIEDHPFTKPGRPFIYDGYDDLRPTLVRVIEHINNYTLAWTNEDHDIVKRHLAFCLNEADAYNIRGREQLVEAAAGSQAVAGPQPVAG